ncbi:MAG TPA: hypothetical protein PLV52_02280 [Candidatus Omnitrophota bacterium]|nr:hypothetical protein [Candidatus Omnitrophota bacterium]
MKINKLTEENIRPYGIIISHKSAKTQRDGNGWGILFKERSSGWRLAYLILRSRAIRRLECHDSPETFEPIKGDAIIALAGPTSPDRFKLFRLDKPILLKKYVWHGVFTISKETHIKITENIKVSSKYHIVRTSKI